MNNKQLRSLHLELAYYQRLSATLGYCVLCSAVWDFVVLGWLGAAAVPVSDWPWPWTFATLFGVVTQCLAFLYTYSALVRFKESLR